MIKYGAWFGILWTFLLYSSSIPIETYTFPPPIGQPWNIETTYRKHEIATIHSVIQGVLAVVLDLYILVLPVPIVLRLQITLKRRLSILAIFGTAVL